MIIIYCFNQDAVAPFDTERLYHCMIAWPYHFKQWPFDKQGHYCAIWSDHRSEENQENPSGHEKPEKKTQKHEWEHSARCTTLRFSQVRVTLATMIPLLWPFDLLILWSLLLCLCSSPTPVSFFANKSTVCFLLIYKPVVQLQPHQFHVVLDSSLSGG